MLGRCYFIAALIIAGISPLLFVARASAQIAPGVTQSAAHVATITGKVTDTNGTPVVGADIKLTGAAAVLTTRTDATGTFVFSSVPWGTYTISASSSLGVASRGNIALNGDINVSIQYLPSSNLRTIAHVSTTSAGAHINVTPASISSISPADFAFQGNTSWTELLDRTPGVTVNGDTEGGEQINDALVGSLIYAQVISINGALPYETSVTLDGMPLESQTTVATPGSGYDLSNLPLAIFPQADIVRGPGADAPSIVDSVGGSFVLHPPGRVEQNQVNFSYSNDPWGGTVANIRIAQRIGNLSITATYGLNDSPGYFGNTERVNAYSGFELPSTIDGKTFIGCQSGGGACGGLLPCNTVPGEGHVTYNYYNNCGETDYLLYGNVPYSSEWSQHTGAVALSYDIARGITAQMFYAGTSGQMPDTFIGYLTDFQPGAGYDSSGEGAGALGPGYHDFVAEDPYNLYQGSSILEEKLTAFLGQGVLRLAGVQNYSFSFSNNIYGSQYPSNYVYRLYGVGYFANAPTTPVVFDGTQAVMTFAPFYLGEDFWTRNRDLLASYTTQVGSTWTVGASYTHTYYNNPDYIPYITGGTTYVLQEEASANASTLNELRVNVDDRISDKFDVSGSWYMAQGYFHVQQTSVATPSAPWTDLHFPYSGPRFGATWRANENTVFRASAGGGFALPPIDDLLGENLTPLSCSSSVCSETAENVHLRPETSFGFDVGTDMRLQQDTTLSFDVYHTNLFGQFFETYTTSTYSGSSCTTPPCTLSTEEYHNLQESRYEGINASVQHQPQLGWYWQASLGLTRAFVVSLPAGFYNDSSCPNTACVNTYILPGENFNGATQSGLVPAPYANGAAIIGYRWQPHEFIDLWPTYYGNGNAYYEPAFMAFDAHGSIPLGKYVSIYATFKNVTGIHGGDFEYIGPPVIAAPSVKGQDPYPLYAIPYYPRSLIVTFQYTGP